MKRLIIAAFIILGHSSYAQTENNSSGLDSERIIEINDELQKLHKKINKSQKLVSKTTSNTDAIESDLKFNSKERQELVGKISDVKNQLNGHDYQAIVEKIEFTEKKTKSLQISNRQKSNLIAKKAARMEKIKAEIESLEEGIYRNEMEIRQNEMVIEEHMEIIDKNGLVEKAKKLDELSKDYVNLERQGKKLSDKIEKNNNTINKVQMESSSLKTTIQNLELEKKKISDKELTSVGTN